MRQLFKILSCVIIVILLTECREQHKEQTQKYTSRTTQSKWVDSANLDCSDTVFSFFSGKRKELLYRYLVSDKRWRVVKYNESNDVSKGVLVAQYNTEQYSLSNQYVALYIRLEDYPDEYSKPRIIEENQYSSSWLGNKNAKLDLYGTAVDSQLVSYFVINSNGFRIEIEERSGSIERVLTQQVLNDLNATLHKLKAVFTKDEFGFDKTVLSPGSVVRSDSNSLQIENGIQEGIYKLHGYINPHKKGYILLDIFPVDKNIMLFLSGSLQQRKQYVGWSDNNSERFHYYLEATCLVDGPIFNKQIEAYAELTFYSFDEKETSLIVRRPIMISGWKR